MKLNYRDRVILLVVIALIIIIGGFFGLIKPRYNDIKENKVQRDTVQAEWDGLDAKIQQIPTLRTAVQDTKKEADAISDKFYTASSFKDVDGNLLLGDELISAIKPYQLDKYMQTIVDECGFTVLSMEAGEIGDTTLEYYYYTPVVPTTAILDLADLNGNYTAEIEAKFEESNAIAERTQEHLFVQQYGINVKTTKEQLWNFMQKIYETDKTIRVDSINILDVNFGIDSETGKLAEGIETTKDSSGQTVGYSTATIVLNLYSVYELDEPIVE